ncbi:MAG: hypothetical protein M3Y26_04565 [Actinomycetota bacterium]|nr:hypothetical protein [Actinomycetota bacterium]
MTAHAPHPRWPAWAREFRAEINSTLKRMEAHMAKDITTAEQDLADAVSATAKRVQDDIAALKAAVAAGNPAAVQAAADAIEAQVAVLANVDPAAPPTPAPPTPAPPA